MATSTLPEEVDAEEESAAKIAASPMLELVENRLRQATSN
jgi:hypothetical protein